MPATAAHLRQILQSGIAAPSAENKHHLAFDVAHDHVCLRATDMTSWVTAPHRRFLALVSFGAVVENMALRAGALGYSQTTQWHPEAAHPEMIARLRWASRHHPPDPLGDAIDARHTNRRFYRRTPLPPLTLQRLVDVAQAVPGAQLLWLAAPAQRALALRAIRQAETERFCRRELHRELFGAVRFQDGWHRTADEWLPPAALEVEAGMRLPFALLRHWPLMSALNLIGMHHMLGLRAAYLPCRLAPHLGLITVAGVDATDRALRAGRALQRTWLAATAEGLAFQPMAAATVLVQQRAGDGWVSARTQERLTALLAKLSPEPTAQACMFFRLGTAKAPTTVTGRKPLDAYLTRPIEATTDQGAKRAT